MCIFINSLPLYDLDLIEVPFKQLFSMTYCTAHTYRH